MKTLHTIYNNFAKTNLTSLRLLLVMFLTLTASTNVWGEDFEKYSGTITEGDYLIVYDNGAMKNTVSSDRLAYTNVTVSNNKISNPDASLIWHIAPSGGYWTIYNANVNKYAAGTGAKNKAQLLVSGTDNKSLWTVSGTSTYEFVNKANKTASVNSNLRRNGTYGFACYATGTGGALTLYKKVTAVQTVAVTGVSLNITSLTLTVGNSETLTATVSPDNATDKTVTWTTNNSSVATVSNGKVTAVAEGSAIITVTTNDGKKTATCNVTVNPKPKYTVTWNVNGEVYETTQVTEGVKPTFPTTPSSCDATSTTFYGWATATWDGKLNDISDKTIYTSASAMPAETATYHAVFCEGSGSTTLINEKFDDTSTTDSNQEIGTTFYNFNGASSKAFKSKYGGVKFGNSSTAGYITSKSLDLSTAFTVTLDACKYGSDAGNIEVTVGTQTKTISNSSLEAAGTFKTFTLEFDPATSTSTVKIGTSSKRAYIDNVIIATGGGASNFITTCAPADPCDALQAPNVTATATANSITLSWPAVSGAISYNIYNYTTEEVDETTSLTYTFTGLSSETEYEWEVEAVSATCNGKGTTGTTTTLKTYTITWKNGDGTVLETDENVPHGTTPTYNGATPTKTATAQYTYTFSDWSPTIYAADKNQIYTAQFNETTRQYTVTFDANGHGSAPDEQSIAYGTKATEPSAPTATGYTFGGWYKEAECTNAWNFATDVVTGNVTLYAKWTEKDLTKYRTFCDVVCGAYSFHTGTGEKETWAKEAIKCFAQLGSTTEWQIEDYIIPADEKFFVGKYGYFYNDNLGTNNSRSLVKTWAEEMYIAPAMDSEDGPGSPKLGHAKGAKGTLRIFDDSEWNNLYVGFIPDDYKLKFGTTEHTFTLHNMEDHEYRSDVVQYNSTNADKNVSVGVVDAAGNYVATNHTQEMRHVFLKVNSDWATDNAKFAVYEIDAGDFKNGFMKLVPGSTDLYEGWVDKLCTKIIFVRHNNTADSPTWENKWNQTGDLTLSNDKNLFTITDWGTGTWSTYEKYGQFAMHDDSKSKNWYVHFVPHYVLTYDKDANDATGEMDVQTVAVDATDKTVVVADCGFTRPGYRFIRWKYDATLNYNAGVNITLNKDITLYAVWEKEYTVTYNANSGTTTCEDNNAYIKEETVTVCATTPTKAGHTFLGWSDGTDTHDAGATFTMPASNVTLTAQWQINTYTVTLNPNYPAGKTGTFTDKEGNPIGENLVLTFNYNTASQTLTDLYKSIELQGYQFNGWFNATAGGSKWVETGAITRDITLYAQWTKRHTVTWMVNGEALALDNIYTSYLDNAKITKLPGAPASRCGKVFVGWTDSEINEETDTPPSNLYAKLEDFPAVTENVTYHAVWADETLGGAGEQVTDVLNRAWTGVSGTSYSTWSGKESTSGAVYMGNTAGGNGSIQMRSNNSESSIVTTTSGGKAKKITVTWNSNTTAGRTLDVYGKNTEYSRHTDLYDTNKGTKIGYIVCGTSTELTISGDYEYIGLRSNSGAMYLDEITITWETEASTSHAAYTTSPVCAPVIEITQGKDIYVTGGNASNHRNTFVVRDIVKFSASYLKAGSTGQEPDIKVPAADITIDGVPTTKVSVDITQDLTLQSDGTYAGIGEITITYKPTEYNVTEDIKVQLRADYNTGSNVLFDAFTVHARSLPEEFVIVAKSGDKWYALNGDMSSSKTHPANGQVVVDNAGDPTKATFAPCNAVYTFDGMPNTGDRTYVRFQGTDGAWLWASSGTNTGIQNNVLAQNPTGDNKAYNWKLTTTDNVTYQFSNANNNRNLRLNGGNFGMYASAVQDIRILPYEAKCLYNYAPTNLKVSVLKGTSVTLTWDAVQGATKYQYSTDATNWTDAGATPTITINGLEKTTAYTYYVRAYHEDAGVSQECIDYAEITFTTADCDDVPADITYSADQTRMTITWVAESKNCTVCLYEDEACTRQVKFADELNGSVTFSQLDRNTTYYVRVFAEGTCASPIVPVKTEDVKMDIVEWKPDGIVVDINTNEKVKVTLENEVSFGSGTGTVAEDLFFSKYFEGSGSLKMLAIYNGTGKDVDLSTYRIDRGSNGNGTDIKITYDLSQLGTIKNGQEIVFYSWPLAKNTQGNPEYSYECSKSYLNNVATKSGQEDNPRWILCGDDPTEKATPIYDDAMNFSGDDPLLLRKNEVLIDVIGVSTEATRPTEKTLCAGRSEEAWSADGVTNMDYGKTEEDFEGGVIPHGVNVDDKTFTAYTARVIMFRKNTVVSGKDAVTKNIDDFVTFADEWEARQVCMSGDDGNLTCAAYQELGKFNYSEYYTKYVSMNQDQVFEENARNADGTVTIPITDLNKQSCRNIKITIKDASDKDLKTQTYKVPIMITTTQGTDGQAFLALQENLATVEIDGGGNPTGNKTNLTLEEVREICKTCDVVVRDNATLTKVATGTANDHPRVNNVYIYEGASLNVPEDTEYSINTLSFRRKGDVVASADIQGDLNVTQEDIYLDVRIDAQNWHWFTLPYDCNIADVTWVDGSKPTYGVDWFLSTYDGKKRAETKDGWSEFHDATIEAGKGYIVGILGDLNHPAYTYELRFPMAKEVLTKDKEDKQLPVRAWGIDADIRANHKGWNLVGNPYLNYYQTADSYTLKGLSLNWYTFNETTGLWYEEPRGNVPYLVIPENGGWSSYEQVLASETDLLPFTSYFIQVGDPEMHDESTELNAAFDTDKRGRKPRSIARRAVAAQDEPIIVGVSLTNSLGESDKTSLVIDDKYTDEYEMNADFFKWFGDYYRYYTKPVLYTIGADKEQRAFNALNEEQAAKPISMGTYTAQNGTYSFSLDRRSDLSRVKEVWLHDATEGAYINLMQENYSFSAGRTDGSGRFTLAVTLHPKSPTDLTEGDTGTAYATTEHRTIYVNNLPEQAEVWVYDAVGRLLANERTSSYQRSYKVGQAGVYFVRVSSPAGVQTLQTIVEQ